VAKKPPKEQVLVSQAPRAASAAQAGRRPGHPLRYAASRSRRAGALRRPGPRVDSSGRAQLVGPEGL